MICHLFHKNSSSCHNASVKHSVEHNASVHSSIMECHGFTALVMRVMIDPRHACCAVRQL